MQKQKKRLTRRQRRAGERVSLPAGGEAGGPQGAAPAPPAGGRLRDLPLRRALLLGALVIAAYLPAFEAGFVWDDSIIVNGRPVHDWTGLWNLWFSPADLEREAHYWPVVYTSFWLEHKLWGLAPLGYHAVNVLLHLVNVLLIWRLLQRLAAPGAWVVAAVFAVHPLHVESVAWVIERKDLLSALFYLAAALTWVRFTEGPRPGRYLLALALFTAGLLSKSIVVTLPLALLIWCWWRAGRIGWADLSRLTPFFAIALVVTAADLAFYASREPLPPLDYSPIERVLIASRALWFYAGKLLWPADLMVIYPLWEISAADPVAWTYLLGAAALAGLLWLGRRWFGRGPLAGALFFAVTLAPVLGFVDYGYMQFSLVADRFQYLAGLGVLAVLVGAAARGAGRLRVGYRRVAAAGLAAVLVTLGTLTWLQARIYRDNVTLFSHIVAHNPQARYAHHNLVVPLANVGRLDEALAAARIAVQRTPKDVDAWSHLGHVLLRLERLDEADAVLRDALELDPRHAELNHLLGEALRKRRRHREAVEMYGKALENDPDRAMSHAGIGTALFELKRYQEALAALEKAHALGPDDPLAGATSLFAGRAARETGQLEVADVHFRRAEELQPQNAALLTELSNLRFVQGRRAEAERYLRRALEAQPNDPAGFHVVGERLRKSGRGEEALAAYGEALRIDPDFAPAHIGIGAALLDLGRHREALEALERGIPLVPERDQAATAHYLAGRALEELDRRDEAAAQFESSIEHDPNHSLALNHLAHWRFEQEKYEEALALFRTRADLAPDDATLHSNLAVTLYYLGRYQEGLASVERALQLDPGQGTARRLAEDLRASIAQAGP